MEILNLPIELIKKYKDSKSDKELLSFAIGIKCRFSNSVLTDVSIQKIMRLFHVSHKKAIRLLSEAKESPLFYYSEKLNQLKVNTFKDKSFKAAKNGIKYISDYCYKLDKKQYSIKELCHILTNVLMMNAIHSFQMDKLLKSGVKNQLSCAYKKGLNLRRLAKIAGISLSSTSRTINRMWEEKLIEKTRFHAKLVIPCVNKETVDEWNNTTCNKKFFHNKKDNSGWLFIPTEYTLTESNPRFVHVIYNHKKRKTYNECKSMSSLDKIYSTIHAF